MRFAKQPLTSSSSDRAPRVDPALSAVTSANAIQSPSLDTFGPQVPSASTDVAATCLSSTGSASSSYAALISLTSSSSRGGTPRRARILSCFPSHVSLIEEGFDIRVQVSRWRCATVESGSGFYTTVDVLVLGRGRGFKIHRGAFWGRQTHRTSRF